MMLYAVEKLIGASGKRWRVDYEVKRQLPGFNTIRYNYKGWTEYDWSSKGDEWDDSRSWKNSIIDFIINKNFRAGGRFLEIGPGAGKWSRTLSDMAEKLILVDITEVTLDICRKILDNQKCEFYVNDGQSLSFIASNSIDHVWAFDTFVHIAPQETAGYLKEIGRVLKSGGMAIIHHPRNGGHKGGFRSSVTNEFFLKNLASNDLEIQNQFSSWGKHGEFSVTTFDDIISVFRKG